MVMTSSISTRVKARHKVLSEGRVPQAPKCYAMVGQGLAELAPPKVLDFDFHKFCILFDVILQREHRQQTCR